MTKKFYITTTIPYANAPPHIGHALEFIQADVLARWKKINGYNVFFLTGTDEHGHKNYKMAKEAGMTPQKFVDKNSEFFKELVKELNISNSYFIRTTDKKIHWPGVVELWKRLSEKGDIYKKKYEGHYCVGCERFVTERDLVDGKCPNHPSLNIEKISEENYFFKLSKYSDKIIKLIKEGKLKISPEKWKNDFLALVKNGLTDVSFSRERKHLPWGVPVPGDDSQIIYVWGDALPNYITGIGFPDKKYKKYWPADVQVVGKDMLRFHTGIWPGMLLGSGLPLPKEVIVHGFLIVEGQKMSKSLGNVVSPLKLRKKYSADSIRYYLMRNVPFGDDGDFSEKALVERHNNELADKLGNLISRTSTLIEKYGMEKTNLQFWEIKRGKNFDKITSLKEIKIEKIGNKSYKIRYTPNEGKFNLHSYISVEFKWILNVLINPLTKIVKKHFDNYELDKVLNEIFAFIDVCNEYIQNKKPWETKDKKVLYELADSIKIIGILLSPFIPETSEKIAKQFKFKIDLKEIEKPLNEKNKIKKSEILFRKIK